MYQAQADATEQMRRWAGAMSAALRNPFTETFAPFGLGYVTAGYEMLAHAGFSHERKPFGIDAVRIAETDVPVREEVVVRTPFATLLHFKKDVDVPLPRVLVVAPMSGHFATLLRATVRTMLPEHDVFLTDWHNARDVSVDDGRFGIDEYAAHVIRFVEAIGTGAHVVAVCQPCVAVLEAVAVMAEAGNPAQPRSMTLMAGPVDARVSPTRVNELSTSHPIAWFEENLISTVPSRFRGANRRVYPGFLQLAAFVSMNPERHAEAHWELYNDLAVGKDEKAKAIASFYDEYFAVADLTAEFYLETVKSVFQEYDLARGTLTFEGRPVNPAAVERTALLTVEGERDDVCGIGQTMAAHELCTGIRPSRKRHHLQPGVGHYGVFSGRRWTQQIYPLVRNLILSSD
ncbi:MAG TPA: polyhydroxyalkanoate depolymerase [Candidatus Lustribacter sp.]|nr:polyhydroxyalkanoate depolymerase [Candidatus Lustribacter sp.]